MSGYVVVFGEPDEIESAIGSQTVVRYGLNPGHSPWWGMVYASEIDATKAASIVHDDFGLETASRENLLDAERILLEKLGLLAISTP